VYLIVTYLVGVVLFVSAYAQPFYRSADDLGRLVTLALLAMPMDAPHSCVSVRPVQRRATVSSDGRLAALYLLVPLVRMSLCGAVVGWIYRPTRA
jgi:hypothetical protein